jgi:tetratricopeptide (TPR) repeat protein
MGKMNDLEAAIQAAQQAVEVTPKDHPDLAVCLNNLGNMLGNRYEQTGKMDNLEDAIQVAQQAVEVTPKDHPNLAAWLNNLGKRLGYRYGRIGEIHNLEKAIQVTQQAVEDTPKGHPDLAARLNNLGTMLKSRYERIRKMEDLEEAIQLSRRAVEVTPEDHPDLTGRLINLSRQLLSLDSPMELEALELLLRAWKCSNAPPLMRIRAAREAIQLLQAQMDYIGAYKISTEAIDLLPRVHSRSLTLEDQQYVVSLFSGLANNACSLALQTREPPAKAVELLERGRGVILGLLMDDRRDNAELKAAHPTLHAQYESLRAEVNRTVDNITDQIVQQVMVK